MMAFLKVSSIVPISLVQKRNKQIIPVVTAASAKLNIGEKKVKLKSKFPKKNERDSDEITVEKGVFTKINPNLSNGRNTSKNIEEYTKLYIRGMEELKAYLEAFDE